MKVSIYGSSGTPLCQISDLRKGFAALGHEHCIDPCDPDVAFLFEGNPPFSFIEMARAGTKKTIFNVLDIPHHLPNVSEIVTRYREHLPLASRVTAISETVARDVETHCGVKANVIYYPMKDVRHTGERKYPQFKVAMVGRLCDPSKRSGFAVQALVRAGFQSQEVAIVGPEYLGWGTRMGLVDEQTLSDIYNSVDYVISLSLSEGIGLVPIEAACCGAIPIVAPDLTTFNEFWVDSPLGLHYQGLRSVDAVAALITAIEKDADWKAQLKRDFLAHANAHFRPKFEAVEVARRILSTYQTIV